MKTRNRRWKLVGLFIGIVLTVVGGWLFGSSTSVKAVQDPENMPGSFGLARGQTARLNVLNSGEQRGYIIDWKFLDSLGRVVSEGPQPHLIPVDQFKSFDLDADSLAIAGDQFGRIQLRAVVTALGGPDTNNLHVSLEVFDKDTGKTTFVLTNPSNDK
ncbi:MAG TPA: hypothetical protein VGJ66_17285 [Pyrinomonadaceae bacterium]|jgi:hypothetical protein